jgi:hypothetical protein
MRPVAKVNDVDLLAPLAAVVARVYVEIALRGSITGR